MHDTKGNLVAGQRKKGMLIFAFLPLLISCGDSVKIPSNKEFYVDPPVSHGGWLLGLSPFIIFYEGQIYESHGKYYFVDTHFIFHGNITENTVFDLDDKHQTIDDFIGVNVTVRFSGQYTDDAFNKNYKWINIPGTVREDAQKIYAEKSSAELKAENQSTQDGMDLQWYRVLVRDKEKK